VHLVALPLDHRAVRLQAAVVNHGNAVLPFGSNIGVFERLIRIARDFLAAGLGARPCLAQVGFLDEVGKHFVIHLDLAQSVVGNLFGGGCHGRHFHALPLDLGPFRVDDVYRLDARRLLGVAGVDLGDAGMRVRASHVGREQQTLRLQIRSVLGAAAGFLRAVQALDRLADDFALVHRRPAIIRRASHFSLPSFWWRPQGPPGGCPCTSRSGRDCHPAHASRRPWSDWDVRPGSPWPP
jgi:hypothetical protein